MRAKPNVLLILTDQQRFDALSCMGHKTLRTPNLDRFAAAGTLFRNAHCAATVCIPSRVSLFTGQYVHTSGSVGNSKMIHAQQHSLVEAFKHAGYRLGLAGKNHTFEEPCRQKLFDYWEEYDHHGKRVGTITSGDTALREYMLTAETRPDFLLDPTQKCGRLNDGLIEDPVPFPEEHCTSHRIVDDGIAFMAGASDNPFFLYLSLPDPHSPYVVCEPYSSMYPPETIELEAREIDWSGHPLKYTAQAMANGFDRYTDLERKRILASYYGQVALLDKALGRIFDHLEKSGMAEDTIVLFTSDHGDFGGRYGLIGKTSAFPDVQVRVPLIACIPGLEGGRTSDALISNIDLLPTVMDCIGLDIPTGVQGESFLDVLRGKKKDHRTEVFAEVGRVGHPPKVERGAIDAYRRQRQPTVGARWFIPLVTHGRSVMIKRDDWKFCYHVGDLEELYDLANDPCETRNLAYDPQHAARKEELKNRVMDWLLTEPFEEQSDP